MNSYSTFRNSNFITIYTIKCYKFFHQSIGSYKKEFFLVSDT